MEKGQDRASVITLRLKPSELKALQNAAKGDEKTLSAWARGVLFAQADLS